VLLFFTFYTASGLVAGGKLFETVFGLPYTWAVAAGAGAVLAYTFIGGFLAVSWTDAFQGMLMLVALMLVAAFGVAIVGGLDGLSAGLRGAQSGPAQCLHRCGRRAADADRRAVAARLGPRLLRPAAHPGPLHGGAFRGGARRLAPHRGGLGERGAGAGTLVGLTGAAWLDPPLQGADSEKVFMAMATALLHPVVAGVCLAGILAAVMSTADSQLLVASSAVSEDLYRDLLRRDAARANCSGSAASP
jgi:sodium/proline symporter